jgi:hypothetical protein
MFNEIVFLAQWFPLGFAVILIFGVSIGVLIGMALDVIRKSS